MGKLNSVSTESAEDGSLVKVLDRIWSLEESTPPEVVENWSFRSKLWDFEEEVLVQVRRTAAGFTAKVHEQGSY